MPLIDQKTNCRWIDDFPLYRNAKRKSDFHSPTLVRKSPNREILTDIPAQPASYVIAHHTPVR
jgi:hypothetical protein